MQFYIKISSCRIFLFGFLSPKGYKIYFELHVIFFLEIVTFMAQLRYNNKNIQK